MKELVEVIAKALVDHPEMVKVRETENERSIVLELTVAPEDMGKVIGRNGRIARAIRTVVKSSSARLDKKVIVEIL
ncbi:MAG TPA: KH domain-containing protein [Bacillota bacterium]|nr:KH domain-containing protein [Clostridia bacterium]MDD3437973.1 KH domain-containing protein [Clostridiaceae bacterium]HNR04271.1 KH domain-containing protein [Bacillota bacterium]HNT03094.1 KH domain-containing protein [Bacillota bacterium]HNU79488.1 KH domain-containing protein [Bacillota bacterium]